MQRKAVALPASTKLENIFPSNEPKPRATTTISRRQLITSTVLLGLGACGRRRATGFPGFALVTSAVEGTLAIVDLDTFELAHRLDLGAAPSYVAADAESAYVLTPANGTVHLIDPDRARRTGRVRLSSELDFLRLTPVANQLLGVASTERELVIGDTKSLKVLRRLKLEGSSIDLDVATHTLAKRVFAASSGGSSGWVEVIDVDSGSHSKRQFPGELGSIRFRRDGQLLFVANYSERTLLVLEPQSLNTVCELPLPMRPENLSFSTDNGQLFVSGTGMDGVSVVYAYDTLEVEQTVLAGRAPGAMACSENPRYLFVASRAGSEVSIFSVDTRKLIALTEAGDKPTRILVTPDQQYLLVLNSGSGDMAVIHIPSIKGNRLKNGASLFAMIPVARNPVEVAIAPRRPA